jgi:hypothetical protein
VLFDPVREIEQTLGQLRARYISRTISLLSLSAELTEHPSCIKAHTP